MDAFIRSQIRELKRTRNVRMPKPAQCMVVTEQAPRSLAGEAGVAVKDFLVSLDDEPGAALVHQTWFYRADEHRWLFYSRPRHELVALHATGIEPGVMLRHTPDAIKERYDPKQSSPAEFEALWEARDWEALARLSAATLAAYGRDQDTPALVFSGAALYETGRTEDGLALVDLYQDRFASHWTMNFRGIGYYCQALALLRGGQKERGLGLLQTAFEHNACSRLADAVQKYTGTRPPLNEPRWLDRIFPDYRLPRLEGGEQGDVALADAAGALGPGELFAVCLLATYRGNGPHNDFMMRYLNFGRWFGPFLKGLHVVTMEPDRPKDRPHYLRGEDAVVKAGLPLDVLLEDGSLTAEVQQAGSPFIVLVDRDRRVRAEGELSSVDLWNALAAVNA
jgi:hypothetical protein